MAGPGPTWATEAGFHNALNAPGKHAPGEHAPVSEAAGGVYIQRMFLEHFASGVARTYAYELVDVWPDPGRRNPDHHFGLLRADFSPKPAFTALKNLLTLVGRDERRARLRPLRLAVDGADGDLRRLVLRRADGSYVVALWRRASVWDRDRRRPVRVRERPLTLTLPDATRVARADPLVSATTRPLALRNGRARLRLAGRPLVLVVETGGSTRRDRR